MDFKVLVVEDDAKTRNALVEILEKHGLRVTAAHDGCEATKLLEQRVFDLVCLDVMMPGLSGYEVCRRLRSKDWNTGIIFITAKADEIDRVVGLELGADDYIVKPFGAREVTARISAVMRRIGLGPISNLDAMSKDDFKMHDVVISPSSLKATRDGQSIDLTLREVRILYRLWQSVGKIVTRNELLLAGWTDGSPPQSRTLDQTISALRGRLDRINPSEPLISTVYGVGYRFEPNANTQKSI
ncbi:MAG: response regulator transcription factor [Planctomycetota bacterium]